MSSRPAHSGPMSVSSMIDEAVRIYRRNFRFLIIVSLISQVPNLVIVLTLRQATTTSAGLFSTASAAPNPQAISAMLGGLAIAGMVGLIFLPISFGLLVKATTDLVLGRPATVGSVIRGVLPRYFTVLGFVVLAVLAVYGLSITVIGLPFAIWILIRWTLAGTILFAEDRSATAALGRSWRLVKGSWWRTLGILLLASILVGLVLVGFQLVASGLTALVSSGASRAPLQVFIETLLGVTTAPVLPLVLALLYVDRRARVEGSDLDQLALAAAASAAGQQPPPHPPAPGRQVPPAPGPAGAVGQQPPASPSPAEAAAPSWLSPPDLTPSAPAPAAEAAPPPPPPPWLSPASPPSTTPPTGAPPPPGPADLEEPKR